MTDKKLYNWLLILVDDAGKGTYMSGRTTLDTIPIDVADSVPSLGKSDLLNTKLPKFGREVMKRIGNWREPKS